MRAGAPGGKTRASLLRRVETLVQETLTPAQHCLILQFSLLSLLPTMALACWSQARSGVGAKKARVGSKTQAIDSVSVSRVGTVTEADPQNV